MESDHSTGGPHDPPRRALVELATNKPDPRPYQPLPQTRTSQPVVAVLSAIYQILFTFIDFPSVFKLSEDATLTLTVATILFCLAFIGIRYAQKHDRFRWAYITLAFLGAGYIAMLLHFTAIEKERDQKPGTGSTRPSVDLIPQRVSPNGAIALVIQGFLPNEAIDIKFSFQNEERRVQRSSVDDRGVLILHDQILSTSCCAGQQIELIVSSNDKTRVARSLLQVLDR
ncbi:hypothetical protein H4W33_002797 [Kibdelosporangium phytohabitans]|nr:hypothetical protein [Kibdelosporangium phytohabitans]